MWYRNRYQPRWFIWLCSLAVGILIGWAYYMEIEQVVRAQGKVTPTGQNKKVQHLEGGIVANILVKEGDIVKQGDTLFHIKNAFANADLLSLDIQLHSLVAQRYRFNSQINNSETFVVPEDFQKQYPKLIERENRLMKDSILDFKKQQQALKSAYKRKRLKINELKSAKKNLQVELNLAEKELQLNLDLLNRGAASERDLLDSQKRLQSLKTQHDKTALSIPTAESGEREAAIRIEQNKARYLVDVRQKLNKVNVEIEKIEARKSASQDRKQRSDVIASVNGVINNITINTIGGIIRPGDELASITPLDATLIIEAKVKEADRGDIWVEQPVKVKLRAYDYSIYGSIDGSISYISPDSFHDERDPNLYYYRVNIQLRQKKLSDDQPLRPGMLSDVDILTGKKTILQLLTGPILKAWGQALREN